MNEKSKAQRLADILQYKIPSMECLEEAAAELRRLDALNAELVEALNLAWTNHGLMLMSDPPRDAWKHFCVDAAIRNVLAKAKEQT